MTKKLLLKKTYILPIVLLMILISSFSVSCSSDRSSIPLQLQEGSGDHVARIYINNYGSFDLRLFENESKTTVNSFINLAEEGFYNGKSVYSVINDYCLLMGDKSACSDSNEDVDKEFKKSGKKLYPLTGSLCVINDGSGITAEHFMIVTADDAFLTNLKDLLAYKMITLQEYFKTAYGKDIDESTLDIFYKYGGAPWLMGDCIVFGQIFDGMDIVNKISSAEVTEDASYSPLEDIIIDHIEVK